jgi:hypothetical protein
LVYYIGTVHTAVFFQIAVQKKLLSRGLQCRAPGLDKLYLADRVLFIQDLDNGVDSDDATPNHSLLYAENLQGLATTVKIYREIFFMNEECTCTVS